MKDVNEYKIIVISEQSLPNIDQYRGYDGILMVNSDLDEYINHKKEIIINNNWKIVKFDNILLKLGFKINYSYSKYIREIMLELDKCEDYINPKMSGIYIDVAEKYKISPNCIYKLVRYAIITTSKRNNDQWMSNYNLSYKTGTKDFLLDLMRMINVIEEK